MRVLVMLLLFLSLPAFATGYVPLRERLSAEELRAIGLSDAQVDQLDAALRASEARHRKQAEAQGAIAPAPRHAAPGRRAALPTRQDKRRCVRDPPPPTGAASRA